MGARGDPCQDPSVGGIPAGDIGDRKEFCLVSSVVRKASAASLVFTSEDPGMNPGIKPPPQLSNLINDAGDDGGLYGFREHLVVLDILRGRNQGAKDAMTGDTPQHGSEDGVQRIEHAR